jgi:hypothetical protein
MRWFQVVSTFGLLKLGAARAVGTFAGGEAKLRTDFIRQFHSRARILRSRTFALQSAREARCAEKPVLSVYSHDQQRGGAY